MTLQTESIVLHRDGCRLQMARTTRQRNPLELGLSWGDQKVVIYLEPEEAQNVARHLMSLATGDSI